MKYQHKILFSFLLIFIIASCKPDYGNLFKENTDNFELHRNTLNNVIVSIEKNYIVNWNGQDKLIPIDDSIDESRKQLEQLGIESIEISRNPNEKCENNYWITLNISNKWNIESLKEVKLVYAPCEEKTLKYYHYFDGYHRDFWGQGDNWFIYSDTDAY